MLGRSLISSTVKTLFIPAFNLQQAAGSVSSVDKRLLISGITYHAGKHTHSGEEIVPELSKRKITNSDSQRVICRDIEPGKSLTLKPLLQPTKDFCAFVESSPKADVVGFFRNVAHELEGHRQLQDFHMKIRNGSGTFRVDVFYGDEKTGPEVVAPGECISCFANAPLYPGKEPGVKAGECILQEFSDQIHVRCSLDAKARCGFIITPVRHMERMSDLDDEELFALWSVAVRALRSAELPFITMILNHGTYRNIPHLHLKVWVESELHRKARMKWSQERIELWMRLQELARTRPKRQQECMFFKQKNWCRNGDQCSFLHVVRH